MNILTVIHSLKMGGAERATALLANEWVALGHDVTLATIADDKSNFYTLDPRVTYIPLCLDQDSSSVLQGLVANTRRIIAVRRLIRQMQPEIVLGMMTTSSILCTIAARGLNCAVVATERTYPPRSELTKLWQTLRRIVFPMSNAIVVQTEKGAQWIKENITTNRVIVLPNALTYPMERQSPVVLPNSLIGASEKIILAVGRLSAEKGLDDLIRICAALLPQAPDWRLVIVGDGPQASYLQQLAKNSKAADQIIFVGRAGNVADWYERADIYAMTSHFEGFPNTLAEAMAHGCPAIAFDVDTGPRDLIIHNQSGYLVGGRSIATFQQLLWDLMNNESKRKLMAQAASHLRYRLETKEIAGRWIDLFKALTRNIDALPKTLYKD